MWERWKRRTMAPSRPALDPDRAWLVVFTFAALAVGFATVAWIVFG